MIKKGDLVKICIPPEACRTVEINSKLAHMYNGCVGIVSKVKAFYHKNGSGLGAYCEIEDIVTAKGVPYVFDVDWIVELDPEEV